jgi:ATP-dependent RNA helicase DeaD
MQMTDFAELGLSPDLLQATRDVGYENPSPIQEQAIPLLLEGLDVIGQAQTGSGKTAAFGLPMLQYVDPTEHDVQGLVLTPTRELCIQVTQALRAYGKTKGIDVVAVFGGAPIRTQQAQLRAGGHIVVGTVGRVKDLISRHSLMLNACRFVVLDEADEMLDLGFLEDVEKILALTPSSRQTALFSATMPAEIRRLADQYLYDPVIVKVKNPTLTVDTVEQFALEVQREGRPPRRGVGGRTARSGARVRAHEDPLRRAVQDAPRQRHERQGAARGHEPGVARRSHDLLQGRPPSAAGGHRRRLTRA